MRLLYRHFTIDDGGQRTLGRSRLRYVTTQSRKTWTWRNCEPTSQPRDW